MSTLVDFMLALAHRVKTSREIHSADGRTYIDRVDFSPKFKRGGPVWLVVVSGSPFATFFRREDARVFIREAKFLTTRYGRELEVSS